MDGFLWPLLPLNSWLAPFIISVSHIVVFINFRLFIKVSVTIIFVVLSILLPLTFDSFIGMLLNCVLVVATLVDSLIALVALLGFLSVTWRVGMWRRGSELVSIGIRCDVWLGGGVAAELPGQNCEAIWADISLWLVFRNWDVLWWGGEQVGAALILSRSDISVRNSVRHYSLNILDQALIAYLLVLELAIHRVVKSCAFMRIKEPYVKHSL